MKRRLLDTCAILHLAHAAERLSAQARREVTVLDAEVYVSVVGSAELACLQNRGRGALRRPWRDWLRAEIAQAGWGVLPITLAIMEEAFRLPEPIHRDPADRILIATARAHSLALVTTDALILGYPHVTTLA